MKATKPAPVRQVMEVDSNGKKAHDNGNGSVKPKKKESLLDRLDAILIGTALSAGTCYLVTITPGLKDMSHATMPFVHSLTYEAPIVATVGYLFFVHVFGPWYNKGKGKPDEKGSAFVDFLLRAWNLFLAYLSYCMLIGMGVPVIQHWLQYGWRDHLCDAKMLRWEGPMLFWIWVFGISKYFELIDTAFLVLRNRPVNFLHWYHHASVLLYTWFAIKFHLGSGYTFAPVNAFVHTFMYWYYYRRACGVVLSYDKGITQIQISQMVLGMFAASHWAYYHFQDPTTCDAEHPLYLVAAAVVMYGSYFYLFASFYLKRYLAGKAGASVKDE